MPSLESIYSDYHPLGYEGITVNIGDDANTVRAFARNYSYLFVLDADSSTWSLYNQNNLIPLNYVIDNDPDQTIVFWMEGFNEMIIRAYIEACLEGVEEDETVIGHPLDFARDGHASGIGLLPNYPNPFAHTTTIPYRVAGYRLSSGGGFASGEPAAGNGQLETADLQPVSLNIYDLTGRLVRTLVKGPKEPGCHRVVWDRRDFSGREVESGVYFCRLTAGDYSGCRKLTVLP